MWRKFFVAGVVFVLLAPITVSAYVTPGAPSGYVNDYAAVMSETERGELESQLSEYEKKTGNEIAVAVIKSLDGDTVENFSEKLFAEWGIGKEGKDNGVLFLVALDDHKMRIEVGYGLEPVLTDAESYWIIERVAKPAFQNNEYARGIREVTQEIQKAIDADVGEPPASLQDSTMKVHFDFSPLALVLFVWVISVLARSKSWWAGGIIGGVIGSLIGFISGFVYAGIVAMSVLTVFGLLFDFLVSREYQQSVVLGKRPRWWAGGSGLGRRSSGGGGFGGFGGGRSGGGGASGGW